MKIDTSTISGFDAMSVEDKLKAILSLEVPDPVDLAGYVKKDVFDAKATEAARLSKQLKEKMTDDEQTKEAEARAKQELEEKYNALLKESAISKYKARYLAIGYDEKLAEDTATALFEGNVDKVFANNEKFNSAFEQRVKADVLKGTPAPAAASGSNGGMTREKIMEIRDHSERQAAIMNNLDLFGKDS